MKQLYYLQQKVGMTNAEATALGTLLGLFLLGMAVKYVGAFEPPFDDSIYAEVDSLFALGVSRLQNPGLIADASLAEVGVSTETDQSERAQSPPPRRATSSPPLAGSVDINSAGRADLQRLPGIGPALADRILEYRSAHGPFSSESQLTAVSGIGPKTLDKLRPHISVSPPPSD
jgi:competence protein ComEA